jgi:hypothetical protein
MTNVTGEAIPTTSSRLLAKTRSREERLFMVKSATEISHVGPVENAQVPSGWRS